MENSRSAVPNPVVMTIAGSDSGGGAGLQADLKTFTALGCFGTSAVTCITAQNPDNVLGVETVSPDMVALQIEAICRAFPVRAAKTGMLYSDAVIDAVCRALDAHPIPILVVDPVMIATSGGRLIESAAMNALRQQLLPRAYVMTPNIPEAEALLGGGISTTEQARVAAKKLANTFGVACLLKGGHLQGEVVTDILWDGTHLHCFEQPRLTVRETHGTGCTFAAAMTAFLALGNSLAHAAEAAQNFVATALASPIDTGTHFPLGITPLTTR